jgi:hypothetical protein
MKVQTVHTMGHHDGGVDGLVPWVVYSFNECLPFWALVWKIFLHCFVLAVLWFMMPWGHD